MTSRRTMDPLLILGSIIMVAVALTWVIPAGQYERSPDQNSSCARILQKSVIASSWSWRIASLIPQGLVKAAPIVFFVLLSGAELTVVEITGAIGAILHSFARYFVRRPLLILPLVSLLFLFGGASYAMSKKSSLLYHCFVP
jgi:uncharacterized ion transporter superfamily protein YfcC